LPRTTSGTRTTGWEPLDYREYTVIQIDYFNSKNIIILYVY